ncbi:unnamed protein product [Orchesella dallaii]|uniref:Uncharacterized protein n=1 Tax=Orchesella dallaii TaxID=48710 RepID=A0ABP1RL78_9HEXA
MELKKIAEQPGHEKYKEAQDNLTMIGSFCTQQNSFAQEHGYASNRGWSTTVGQTEGLKDFLVEESFKQNFVKDLKYRNIHNFCWILLQNTIPCSEIVRLCKFEGFGATTDCKDTLMPVVKEYGKCCTFNMLPLPLLYKNADNASIFEDSEFSPFRYYDTWESQVISEWARWDYEKTLILPPIDDPEDYKESAFPFRQFGPGKKYGLSLLLDVNKDDYFCPALDSEGFMFSLHSPLEVPYVMDFPAVLDVNKEIFVNVEPDLTLADPDIRELSSESRRCYFENEMELKLYKPYTS